jgi:DNA invertase Pin-like site-specific DNA recombinase
MKNTTEKPGQKVIGYLRVSTIDQDTGKNESDILKFANSRGFGKVEFVSEKSVD